MSVRDLQFAEGASVRSMAKAAPKEATSNGGRAVRRAPSWRRNGPQAVAAPSPERVRSIALDAVAVALGLGIGLAVVAAITIFSTF
jgi:hypothetical protein